MRDSREERDHWRLLQSLQSGAGGQWSERLGQLMVQTRSSVGRL